MKRFILLALIILGAAFSAQAQTNPGIPDPTYLYYDPGQTEQKGPLYAVDFEAQRVMRIPGITGIFVRRLSSSPLSGKDIFYAVNEEHEQNLYVVNATNHAIEQTIKMGFVPKKLYQRGYCWAFDGPRVFFFGNGYENGAIYSYDSRQNKIIKTPLIANILDAASDLHGHLYVATSGAIRRYDAESMTIDGLIPIERELGGLFRVGSDIVVIDWKNGSGGFDAKWTRFGSNGEAKGQESIGQCSGFSWRPGPDLLMINQTAPPSLQESTAALIVVNAFGSTRYDIPGALASSCHRLAYPHLYIWGANSVSEIDLRTGISAQVSLEGKQAGLDFFPAEGGGSGTFCATQFFSAATYTWVVDFQSVSAMRIPAPSSLTAYLPGQKCVVLSRYKRIEVLSFPGGAALGKFRTEVMPRELFDAGDGRHTIVAGDYEWLLFDAKTRSTRMIMLPPLRGRNPLTFKDSWYREHVRDINILVVLRQDGVHVLGMPEGSWIATIPFDWDIGGNPTPGELRQVPLVSSGL